ncbi:MAG TPA: hypothetical protein VFH78_07095 [Candidatus Thermoplasmatota archaeon]|nr:hypothetical protein [Candidatus Thermoplasmatota archaeon]
MSEVIENYIRKHPDLSERDAFEGFLKEDRIKAWVGTDESRRERLRSEFGRVWGTMHVAGQMTASGARSGPSGPSMQAPRTVRVDVHTHAKPPPPETEPAEGLRKLQVMCTACGRIDVWMQGATIACRSCGHTYDDMLQLIRVTPVGPFEFLFGGGWAGYATATGIAGGLALLYFLLRGF